MKSLGSLSLCAVMLVSCGGGGSQDGNTTPPPDAQATVLGGAHTTQVLLNDTATLNQLKTALNQGKPRATRFKAYVDSELANPGSNYAFSAWHAALMYQVTGDTTYADFAVTLADKTVADEEALIAAGQSPQVAGDSYLYVGEMIGDVALVYDWCFSRTTASQRQRWIAYMNQAVNNVWHPTTAQWNGRSAPWSGWSVDDPSDNYYYSFLRATMLLGLATQGDNAQAATWRQQFRTAKVGNQLIPTFNADLTGGGSLEGTGYGVSMKGLFRLYDWWERSTGERLATLTPHTLASQAWMMHNIVPTLDRLAAVGDQARDSAVWLFDYHREYLLSLMSLFPRERLSSAAYALLNASALPEIHYGFELYADFLDLPDTAPTSTPATTMTDLSDTYWAPGTGHLMMRAGWTDRQAAYSHLICGPYTQSHAHRDQGAFQLYRGEWLAPTGNIYTHSGIHQDEELNNLVRVVNGSGQTVMQQGNQRCNLTALADNALYTYALAQVTPMYAGQGVTKMEREYLFIKPATFVVFDRAAAGAGSSRVWTLNLPGAPTVSGDHLSYTGDAGNQLDVYRLAPSGLSYQVVTPTFPDGDNLLQMYKQVNVSDTSGTSSLFLHVMGTNGSVSSVMRSDATGQTGVQIALQDGRTVTVRFANTGMGGTLDIRTTAGATVQTSGTLPSTVTAPPLFRN